MLQLAPRKVLLLWATPSTAAQAPASSTARLSTHQSGLPQADTRFMSKRGAAQERFALPTLPSPCPPLLLCPPTPLALAVFKRLAVGPQLTIPARREVPAGR